MHPLLKPHQVKTVEYNLKNRYVINALQMGLGKSFVAIETGVQMKARTLVICPAYLKLKWKSEIKKFHPTAMISVLDNAKEFYRLWDTDFCIISYSFVEEAEILFEWADLVVWDEAHYLKSTTAKRTNAAHKLIYENSLKSCLLLTGTPIKNRVHEFYSLVSICKYAPWLEGKDTFLDLFPTWLDFADKFSYLNQYEVEVTTKKGQTFMMTVDKWSGVKNLPELKKILANHYIEFKSKDVLDLPPYEIVDIPVLYENDDKLLALFESGMGGTAKSEAALAMAPHTVKFAKDLSEYGPVVIFSDHVDACEKIAKSLGVPAITGAMSPKRRDFLAQQFMNGESTYVVATIGSFSTGNDLQIASKMIFNDPSWVPGDILQAMFRIIRIGQKEQCHFYRMVGSYQSQYIYDTVFEKAQTIEKTLEGIK